MSGAPEEIVGAVIEAINRRDGERLADLLSEDGEIVTGRAVHAGPEAARAWLASAYDHLERRYVIDEIRVEGGGERATATARVQYLWRESGEVGDESPITIAIDLDGERVSRVRFAG